MPYLQIMSGERKGQKFGISKDVTIGRSADNTIHVDDAAASSKHCMVTMQGDEFAVVDNNSTNGTYLNGQKVEGSEILNAKDVIKLGEVELMFDGADIKRTLEPTTASAPNTRISIRPGAGPNATVFIKGSGFDKKRDNTKLWFLLGGIIAVILLGGVIWFLFTIMKSQ